jgi:HK97 family phage prohead protease
MPENRLGSPPSAVGAGAGNHSGEVWTQGPLRRAVAGAAEIAPHQAGRVIRYRISDPSVGRDGHTIAADAWELANYLANPVVLWAHDGNEPPIGRMVELATIGDRLMGAIEYPDAETYPFGDMVYRLVKGGYLNATSTGWLPLEWRYAQDRARPGGIDFTRVELLEVSQVPIPALPSALVDARAAGIDTRPLHDWAVRVLDLQDYAIVPKDRLDAIRKASKMPTPSSRADKRTDKPKGDYGDVEYADPGYQEDKKPRYPIDTPEHIKAAWNYINKAKNQEPYSAAEVERIKAKIIAAWKDKIDKDGPPSAREDDGKSGDDKRAFFTVLRRDLYCCAWLAQLLDGLACLEECVELEELAEADGSDLSDRLALALRALGGILVDMTAEEVNELLEEEDMEDHGTQAQRALRALGRAVRSGAEDAIVKRVIARIEMARAGRVLSADNERCLREAHDHMTRACDMVRGVVDQVVTNDEPEDDDEPDPGVALELERARAKITVLRARS